MVERILSRHTTAGEPLHVSEHEAWLSEQLIDRIDDLIEAVGFEKAEQLISAKG